MRTIAVPIRTLIAFVVGAVTALAAVIVLTTAWRADALPGANEATFVPISPCRLADTRPSPDRVGSAAALGPGETETFAATGDVGQCTAVPTNATAVSLNVTALGATVQTFLTIFPGGTTPLAASLNPAPGQPPVPNAVTTPLSGGSFQIYNDVGTVNVVIDVNGYYTGAGLQDVNSRIQALEAQLNSEVATLESEVATLESDIAALDVAQPFVVQGMGPVPGPNLTIPFGIGTSTSIAAATLTAPVDGHVLAIGSANLFDQSTDTDLFGVACSVSDEVAVDGSAELSWEYDGGERNEQIAGSRRFTVSAGQQLTVHLVCSSLDDARISDAVITAIFTPAP